MQATMFQPVGGMDQIPRAFARKLGKAIQYRSVVKEIRKSYQQPSPDRGIVTW